MPPPTPPPPGHQSRSPPKPTHPHTNTHSPALVHANRQRGTWGRRGFRLHFSPTHSPPQRCRGHPVLCAVEALACHTLRSVRPCAIPCGRGFSRPRHRSPATHPTHTQASLHKAEHNTKAIAWEFRFQSTLPDSLPTISRRITCRSGGAQVEGVQSISRERPSGSGTWALAYLTLQALVQLCNGPSKVLSDSRIGRRTYRNE